LIGWKNPVLAQDIYRLILEDGVVRNYCIGWCVCVAFDTSDLLE